LERLAIILEDVRGASKAAAPLAFVVGAGPEGERAVLGVARELRRAGVRCDVSFTSAGLGKQLKAADRRGARFAVVIGEAELARNAAAVKDLGQGEQLEVSLPDLPRVLLEKSDR
jgi:histidyl-tRNA synthetase